MARECDARKRRARLETAQRALVASHAKIHFKFLDFAAFAFRVPAALLAGVGKSREHPFRGRGIAALNNEGAVGNSSLFHGFFPFQSDG